MATKKKTKRDTTAADTSTAAPRRTSASSVAIGRMVVFRVPPADPDDEDAEEVLRPALVIGVTEGGPAPKGSRDEDDATFLDLVVFGQGDQAASILRTVREGDGPGTWAQE